jgi:hypothetical protein
MLKNERACFRSSEESWAACSPVLACTPSGSTLWILLRSSSALIPGSAATSIVSYIPLPFRAVCAVWGSNATTVAPPRLSASPNPKTPTMAASIGGPWRSTVTRSPTWRSCLRAVAASTAISPLLSGPRPDFIVAGFSSSSMVQPTPKVGAPPVVMASP